MGHSARRAATVLGVVCAATLIVLSALNVLYPQRHGLLALSQIVAPYLYLPLLLFVPLTVIRVSPVAHATRRWLRIGLVVCAVIAVVRFVPAWIPAASPPVPAGSLALGVTTWNMEAETLDPAAAVAVLQDAGTGIVGLEELARHSSARIAADPALLRRFPYRVLSPSDGSVGVGLLSSYPFVGSPGIALDPPLIHALLDLGNGHSLDVVVTHPQPAQLRTLGPLPVDFDTSLRDAEIGVIRSTIDPLVLGGEPLVLMGDFNTTEREQVYGELSSGVLDVQRAVGWGPGSTWRPDPVKWLPFGLLRIDMVFAANGVAPLQISPDCTPRGSDHCIVHAAVTVP